LSGTSGTRCTGHGNLCARHFLQFLSAPKLPHKQTLKLCVPLVPVVHQARNGFYFLARREARVPLLAAERLMNARSRARLTEAQGKVCSGTSCKTLKLLLNKALHVASGLTCNFFGKHHECCCQTVMGIAVVRSQAWQLLSQQRQNRIHPCDALSSFTLEACCDMLT
jgi:hypothetical protein